MIANPHPPEYRIGAMLGHLSDLLERIVVDADSGARIREISDEIRAAAILLPERELELFVRLGRAVCSTRQLDTPLARIGAIYVLRASLGRWLMGLASYGPLPAVDLRDWRRESNEELADHLHYEQLDGCPATQALTSSVYAAMTWLGKRTDLRAHAVAAARGPSCVGDDLRSLLARVLEQLVDRKAFSSAEQQALIREAEEAIQATS